MISGSTFGSAITHASSTGKNTPSPGSPMMKGGTCQHRRTENQGLPDQPGWGICL